MYAVKVGAVWRCRGRGEGMPDIELVRGIKHWDIYEIRDEEFRVLVASGVPFNQAKYWGTEGYEIPEAPRITRRDDGLHQFGPVTVAKAEGGWRVFTSTVEYGSRMQFTEAKRLANIEEKKLELAQFRLAMSFVPHSTRQFNLHRLLAPHYWRRLTKEAYVKAGGVCQICGVAYPRLDCHEDWAYDDFRRIQSLDRLISICFLCHRAIHFNAGYLWSEDAWFKVVEHFKHINGIDGEAMHRHEESARWIYNRRLYEEWSVDLREWAELLENHPRIIKTTKRHD